MDGHMMGKHLEMPPAASMPTLSKSRRAVAPNSYLGQVDASPSQQQGRPVRSKKLDLPVKDDTIVGGYRNLGNLSMETARQYHVSRGQMADDLFGDLSQTRENDMEFV